MACELKDFRGKITAETDAVLEALNRAEGRDKSEIAREALHEWAVKKIHAASLITKLSHPKGRAGE